MSLLKEHCDSMFKLWSERAGYADQLAEDFRAVITRVMRPDGAAWGVTLHDHDASRGLVTIRRPKGWQAFAHTLASALGWYR